MGRFWDSDLSPYIDLSSSLPHTSAGSFSVWIRPNDKTTQLTMWMNSTAVTQDYPGFQRYYADGNIYAGFNANGNSRISVSSTGQFTVNTWANWIFSWSVANGQNLYKNNGAVGTPTAFSYTASTITGNRIGAWLSSVTGFFNGTMADFAHWNVELTSNERNALVLGARPHSVRPLSLVAWLPLDGLVSPEPDLSGNAKNGTLNGTFSYAAGPPITMFTPRWPRNIDVGANYWQLYFSKNSGAYEPVTTTSVGVKSADASTDADETKILIPRL